MERYPNPLTPKSLQALMRDERYLNRFHPGHEAYFRFIENGFKLLYPSPSRHMDEPAPAGGPGPLSTVHVRAYAQSRDGNIVPVSEHYRSAPETGSHSDGAAERSPAETTMNPFPFKPEIRYDSEGGGNHGAKRKLGKKEYTHQAADILAKPKTVIVAPEDGRIDVRPAYKDHLFDDEFLAVTITDKEGREFIFRYVTPVDRAGQLAVKKGDIVKAGDLIGFVQDRARHTPGMRNHVHFELKENGNLTNPTSFVEKWRRQWPK